MTSAILAQSLPLLLWFKSVNDTVTEPYLDEVFHVRQAQHYCQNHFTVWDPKITTPPGLYLLSYALSSLFGCELAILRSVGLFCLTALLSVIFWTYATRQSWKQIDVRAAQHSALNITLFPPLFFFSVLYYTDVPSTLSVLLFYGYFLHSCSSGTKIWLRSSILITLGLASLTFRQTNIFWVAIFPAGIVLVKELDVGHQVVKDSMHRGAEGFGNSMMSVARTSWKMEVVFDPPVRDAWLEDYIKTLISLTACTLKTATQQKRLVSLLSTLSPFIVLATLFLAFVLWNGSVVLGDKTNHTATLHLSQMLYIWPYFTFFSWPLLYPYLAALSFGLLAKLQQFAPLESMLIFTRRNLTPRLCIVATFTMVAGLVVHFNTIVHPFTLADNRHYTFYVFKLLMRPWWVKYAVTPVYVLCGWACIQALGARPPFTATTPTQPQNTAVTTTTTPPKLGSKKSKPTTKSPSPEDTKPPPVAAIPPPPPVPTGTTSATTSFTLIWLATTTLQLITAPLVEPRYFILPWIFWRLHLPLQRYSPPSAGRDTAASTEKKPGSVNSKKSAPASAYPKDSRPLLEDPRLWLETVWFLLVNVATGYIFLNREFEWPQEVGKVQRFMW